MISYLFDETIAFFIIVTQDGDLVIITSFIFDIIYILKKINLIIFYFCYFSSDGDGTEGSLVVEQTTDTVDPPHSPTSKHNNSRPYVNPHGSNSHHNNDKTKTLTKYGELVILGYIIFYLFI